MRLLTIIGPGGAGKTRLAAIVAPDEPARAAWLFGAAERLRTNCGATTEPEWWGRTPLTTTTWQETLGEPAFADLHTAGGAAPLNEIISRAIDVPTL